MQKATKKTICQEENPTRDRSLGNSLLTSQSSQELYHPGNTSSEKQVLWQDNPFTSQLTLKASLWNL